MTRSIREEVEEIRRCLDSSMRGWQQFDHRIADGLDRIVQLASVETAEQPEPDFKPFAEESLTIAEETFEAQRQAVDSEVFQREVLGMWPDTPCDRRDLPEDADMMCGGCGGRAGDHSAWRRRHGRPRMTDGCGPEHTYRGSCELRPEDGAR